MGLKYTKYKIFHYKEKLDSLLAENGAVRPPLHIRMKPTNTCSHNCWYCAYKAEDMQLGQDMQQRDFIPKEKMMEIIDDCAEMGVKAITFSGGGDPFNYKYLNETLRRLTDTDIKFASLTHGSNLKGEAAEIFAERGSWLRISIDGWDDESYASYRGVRVGEFSKVINNIKNFALQKSDCVLGISLVVDKDNYTKIYDMASMFKDIGVQSIKIGGCITSNDSAETNAYHNPFFEKAKALAQKVKYELSDDSFEVFDAYHRIETNFEKDYEWCPYLQILTVIGADMNVYSCQDKAYNLTSGVLGSIKDISFKDFWMNNSEKFFKIKPCKDCKHHCVANDKNKMLLEYLDSDRDHLGFV